VVDDIWKALHNPISLLLTNKTIRRQPCKAEKLSKKKQLSEQVDVKYA